MAECLRKGRGSAKYPDNQSIINEIKRRYYVGLPVNYSAIRVSDDALRRRCTALFGGYKYAVEAAGFNYESIRVDIEMSSYYGHIFEKLVKEIFDELRIENGKHPDSSLRPDIVLKYDRWIDVKLSEWTVDNRDCPTIEKYTPHCRTLSIIYMRGREGERMYDGKIRLINVNEYIKQLPRARRGYFYGQVDEIKRRLGEIEKAA